MSHHRCCKCGGGGDDEMCCVCGHCWFPRTDGVPTPANAMLAGSGQAPGCCRFVGQLVGACDFISEIGVCKEDSLFPDASMSAVPCRADGDGRSNYTFTETHCDGEMVEQDLGSMIGLRFLSATGGGFGNDPVCPTFYIPGSGAIAGGIVPGVLIYSGSGRIRGPLSMAHVSQHIYIDPGGVVGRRNGSGIGFSAHVFTVTGGSGGSAAIVRIPLLCGQPCSGGCTHTDSRRVSGGATVTGTLDCEDKLHTAAGSFSASVTLACETGDPCFDADGNVIGHRCEETGEFNISMDFAANVDLSAGLETCPPAPAQGTGDDPDDTDTQQVIMPQEWLDAEPVLKEAYDAIRYVLNLDGNASQGPPPGGQFNALGDVRNPTDDQIEQYMSQDPMRRDGCCG